MNNDIDRYFPALAIEGYEVTSAASLRYNCIAWAAGQVDAWWWPDPMGQGYWPAGVPRQETLGAFVEALSTHGYVPCERADLEPGLEKIAIYVNEAGRPSHTARQLPSGTWTSKLGRLEDIVHKTLESLSGQTYGSVASILIRKAGPAEH